MIEILWNEKTDAIETVNLDRVESVKPKFDSIPKLAPIDTSVLEPVDNAVDKAKTLAAYTRRSVEVLSKKQNARLEEYVQATSKLEAQYKKELQSLQSKFEKLFNELEESYRKDSELLYRREADSVRSNINRSEYTVNTRYKKKWS